MPERIKTNLKGSDKIPLIYNGKKVEMTVEDFQAYLDANSSSSSSLPYVSYNAILDQVAAAPVDTVLEDNLGVTPVWARNSVGVYTCTVTGALTLGKTQIFLGHQGFSDGIGDTGNNAIKNITVNGFTLETYEAGGGGSLSDALLDTVSIEIRVWPV